MPTLDDRGRWGTFNTCSAPVGRGGHPASSFLSKTKLDDPLCLNARSGLMHVLMPGTNVLPGVLVYTYESNSSSGLTPCSTKRLLSSAYHTLGESWVLVLCDYFALCGSLKHTLYCRKIKNLHCTCTNTEFTEDARACPNAVAKSGVHLDLGFPWSFAARNTFDYGRKHKCTQ